jgi:hypothetical protein
MAMPLHKSTGKLVGRRAPEIEDKTETNQEGEEDMIIAF